MATWRKYKTVENLVFFMENIGEMSPLCRFLMYVNSRLPGHHTKQKIVKIVLPLSGSGHLEKNFRSM